MLRSGARALLTILLVVVMAGTAVAFAVGGASPHKTVCVNPISGSSYQICIQIPPAAVSGISVGGFGTNAFARGHVRLTFTNHNKVPVTVTVYLVVRAKSGKLRVITKTFTVDPGQSLTLNQSLKGLHLRGAKLTLVISDTNGDRAIIKKRFGTFRPIPAGTRAGGNGAIYGPYGPNQPPNKPGYRTVGIGNGYWIYIPVH